MIYWAPFLHFYQPPTQSHSVLKKICKESYRPLLKVLLDNPNAKVTINICGVLTEMLDQHGGEDVIEALRQLAKNHQVEFVDSAKFHAILPLIPKDEAIRQIELNRETNAKYFKEFYKAKGFFPPEMCYSAGVARILNNLGYEWVLISGIACQDTWPINFISEVSYGHSSIIVLYRDDIVSNKISFRNLDAPAFLKELVHLSKLVKGKDAYVITAMDAETFGHHVKNWENIFLDEVFKTISWLKLPSQGKVPISKKRSISALCAKLFPEFKEIPSFDVVTISEIAEKFPVKETKNPKPSSWSTTKDDISRKNYYPLWRDENNPIHALQWEHLNISYELLEQALTYKKVDEETGRFIEYAREDFDKALHSCQFWWANKNRGTWNINLINKGLVLQEETVLNAYKAISIASNSKVIKKSCYNKVMLTRDIADKIRDLLLE